MITGRLACASTAAAASTAARSPRSRGAMRVGAIRSSSASDLRMSPGSDRNTGPVGGASAVLAARCTMPRQVGDAADLVGPFDERPRQPRQVGREDRLGDDELVVLLAGGDQDRRGRLLGVVQHPHGVAEPGRDVEVRHRELAGRLRVAVGHRHHGGLLQAEHVAQLVLGRERVHQRQLGGAGIAEQNLDAFLLEQLQEGALSGHDGQRRLQSVLARTI